MTIEKLYDRFLTCSIITTDTRLIKPSSLFFALKGEHFDGNKFAAEAINKGCQWAVIDEPEYSVKDKTILVDDVLTSLQELANFHRKKLSIPIIAITGTNGKTTTKELTNTVLQTTYNVCATKGNLNNHIGVPLTLLSINSTHDVAIIEMGANHIGEIELLCNIAEPDYGLITNIGNAHIEGFGSYEGVIKAKNELYSYLINNNKTIFQNSDDNTLCELTNQYKNIVHYGSGKESNISGKVINTFPHLAVVVNSPSGIFQEEKTISTKLIGSYNLTNILSAISIGIEFKIPINRTIKAIENWQPTNNRSQFVKKTPFNNQLLLDCYNANPTSMKAALANFSAIEYSRKILVLGEMLELGDQSMFEHRKLIELTRKINADKIMLIGKSFENIIPNNSSYSFFLSSKEALEHVKNKPINESLILLKGSRRNRLEDIIPAL